MSHFCISASSREIVLDTNEIFATLLFSRACGVDCVDVVALGSE